MRPAGTLTPPLSLGARVLIACALVGCALAGCGVGAAPDAGTDARPELDARFVDPPTGPLRVATWNLETFPRVPETGENVARLIESEQIDLLAVQEITDPAAFFALAALLPEHEAIVADDEGAIIRVGILYRATRLEVLRSDLLFLDDRYTFPRPVLAATIAVRGPGATTLFDFRFLVVHLKAEIDAESQARRAAAIVRLDRLVRGQLSDPTLEHDYVIAGDWNDDLTDPEVDNVFLPILGDPALYRFLTLPAEESGERTFLPFDAFLDHLLVTEGVLDAYGAVTTEVRHLEVGFDEYPILVSDHLPVVATFAP